MTKEELLQKGAKPVGTKTSYTRDELLQKGAKPISAVSTVEETPQEEPGIFGRIGESLKKRAESVPDFATGNPMLNALSSVGAVAGGIGDIAGELIVSAGKALPYVSPPIGVVKQLLPESTKSAIASVPEKIFTSEPAKRITGAYQEIKRQYPTATRAVEDVANVGSLLPIGKGAQIAGKGVKAGTEVGEEVLKAARNKASTFATRRAESALTEMMNSGVKTKKILDASIARGYNPSRLLASDTRFTPEVIDGKIVPDKAIIAIQGETEPMAKIVRAAVENENKLINIDELEKIALKEADRLKLRGDEYNRVVSNIKRDFDSYRINFGDSEGRMWLADIDDVKKAKYGEINWMNPDQNAADRAVAKAARKTIEDSVEDVSIKDLNRALGEYYDAQEMLEVMGGRAVKGGRLGKMVSTMVGAVVGSPAGMGGSVIASYVANKIAGIMQSSTFRSPSIQKMLGEIRTSYPKIFDEAMQILEKSKGERATRLMLPQKASTPSVIELPSPGILEGQAKLRQ